MTTDLRDNTSIDTISDLEKSLKWKKRAGKIHKFVSFMCATSVGACVYGTLDTFFGSDPYVMGQLRSTTDNVIWPFLTALNTFGYLINDRHAIRYNAEAEETSQKIAQLQDNNDYVNQVE